MSILDDLATVSANLADDLEVSNNPDSYQDPTPPAPVPEGNYRLRLQLELDKGQDGAVRGQKDAKGKFYPTLLIRKSEVIEGPAGSLGRSAVNFERVYTRPFARGDGQANGLADLTRSYDQTRGWNNFEDGFSLAAELSETGTMRCRIGWEAYDKDYAEQLANELGGFNSLTDAQKKDIRKRSTLKGSKQFDKNGIATGPSGATVTARARITAFYPSSDDKVKI